MHASDEEIKEKYRHIIDNTIELARKAVQQDSSLELTLDSRHLAHILDTIKAKWEERVRAYTGIIITSEQRDIFNLSGVSTSAPSSHVSAAKRGSIVEVQTVAQELTVPVRHGSASVGPTGTTSSAMGTGVGGGAGTGLSGSSSVGGSALTDSGESHTIPQRRTKNILEDSTQPPPTKSRGPTTKRRISSRSTRSRAQGPKLGQLDGDDGESGYESDMEEETDPLNSDDDVDYDCFRPSESNLSIPNLYGFYEKASCKKGIEATFQDCCLTVPTGPMPASAIASSGAIGGSGTTGPSTPQMRHKDIFIKTLTVNIPIEGGRSGDTSSIK